MVRRKGVRHKKACATGKGSKVAYKKCLISSIRRTKISTSKSARRAFMMAAKHCKPLLVGKRPAKRAGRKGARKVGTRRRKPAALRVGSWSGNLPRRAERLSHSKYWTG
jgi:hypothetical protein